ncbi:MAG: cupredoxin domain-containing protein [Thermoleophilaceae bacterium]
MQTKRYAGLVAAGAAGVLLVAGCGSSSKKASTTSSNSSAATPASPSSGGSTVNVSETDFKLSPANPSVKQGKVAFKVTNAGQTVHSLEVEGPSGEVKLGKQLQPGQSATMTVDFTKAGKYEWYCPVDGHKAMGMKGEIVAGKGGSASSGTSTSKTTTSSGGGY